MLIDKVLVRRASTSSCDFARGSSSPLLPVIAAFVFFIGFVGISLWFTLRAKGPQVVSQGSNAGGFPTAPALPSNPSAANPNGNSTPGFPAGPSAQHSAPTPTRLKSNAAGPLALVGKIKII